jgi:VanZ family protein
VRGQKQDGLVPTVHWSRYSYCGMIDEVRAVRSSALGQDWKPSRTTPVVPHSPRKQNPSKSPNARFQTNDAVDFSHNFLNRAHFFLIDFDCCATGVNKLIVTFSASLQAGERLAVRPSTFLRRKGSSRRPFSCSGDFAVENSPSVQWKIVVILLLGLLVGSCSEFLQSFFPDRDPAFRDVLINVGGTLAGVVVCFAGAKWSRKWQPR